MPKYFSFPLHEAVFKNELSRVSALLRDSKRKLSNPKVSNKKEIVYCVSKIQVEGRELKKCTGHGLIFCITDPDPGSGAFLTAGSEIRDEN